MLGNDEGLDGCSAGIELRTRKGQLIVVRNREHGPKSEDEMGDVEEAQGRSEEGVEMGGCVNLKETSINVKLND